MNAKLAFVVLFLFLQIVLNKCQLCPDGFIRHFDSCYHFSHDTETWMDSLILCRSRFDADLVEIKDAAENTFITDMANQLKADFWLGGDDLQVEGHWVWSTSKGDITYNNWGPGNPSNSNNDENCLVMHDDDGDGLQKPVWNDDECHKFKNYICEMS